MAKKTLITTICTLVSCVRVPAARRCRWLASCRPPSFFGFALAAALLLLVQSKPNSPHITTSQREHYDRNFLIVSKNHQAFLPFKPVIISYTIHITSIKSQVFTIFNLGMIFFYNLNHILLILNEKKTKNKFSL